VFSTRLALILIVRVLVRRNNGTARFRLTDYGYPAMHVLRIYLLVAPLSWHHIAKDEDVAPALVAIRLAKPPLWERRQGFGTWETSQCPVVSTRHVPLTGRPWKKTGGPKPNACLGMFRCPLMHMQCMVFSGVRVRKNHPRKGKI
jgi:hypothetical protein